MQDGQTQTQALLRVFASREWIDWVSSIEDEVTLNQMAAAYSYGADPFKELLEIGRLYFKEVSAKERFYQESGDQLQPTKLRQSVAHIRNLQVKSPLSLLIETSSDSDEQNQQWLSLRDTNRLAERKRRQDLVTHLKEEIIPCAHKFRPYAIAFALGSCLWPEKNLAYHDAIPTTKELAELWATGEIGAYEQTLEKARCLDAAYDMYIEAQDHVALEIPHLDPHAVAHLMPWIHDYTISAKDAPEVIKAKLNKLFALEDVVFDILEKHKKVLKDNKVYDVAATTHSLLYEELTTRTKKISELKEVSREMQRSTRNREQIDAMTEIIDKLTKRKAEYYKREGNLLCCGTPAPSPAIMETLAPDTEALNLNEQADDVETDSAKSGDSSNNSPASTPPFGAIEAPLVDL